jgi:transitional endoplasmic reticulum ATPase
MFIGATNHADRIDAAALRSRRFEERAVFDVPSAAAMADYVRSAFPRKLGNRWKVPPEVVEKLIDVLRGRTIADAEAVIERAIGIAALRRMRERTTDIRAQDVALGAKEVVM